MTYDERQTAACKAMRAELRIIIERATDALDEVGQDRGNDTLLMVRRALAAAERWNDRLLSDQLHDLSPEALRLLAEVK